MIALVFLVLPVFVLPGAVEGRARFQVDVSTRDQEVSVLEVRAVEVIGHPTTSASGPS